MLRDFKYVQDRLLKVIEGEDVNLAKGLFVENLMMIKELALRAHTEIVSESAIDAMQTINSLDEPIIANILGQGGGSLLYTLTRREGHREAMQVLKKTLPKMRLIAEDLV
jgi:hypothetical protein